MSDFNFGNGGWEDEEWSDPDEDEALEEFDDSAFEVEDSDDLGVEDVVTITADEEDEPEEVETNTITVRYRGRGTYVHNGRRFATGTHKLTEEEWSELRGTTDDHGVIVFVRTD